MPPQLAICQQRIDAMLLPCRLFDDIDPAEEWIRSVDAESSAED